MDNWHSWQTCLFNFDASHQVHIWLMPVRNSEPFLKFLTEAEIQRANKFRVQTARDQFVVARAALRVLLNRYFQLESPTIQFKINQYGKPFLEHPNIFFNVSHSYDWVLIGLSQEMDLGVDIEKMRSDIDLPKLAERFFSKKEVSFFNQLPEAQKAIGFFNAWTRKEAYIKARGMGLAIPLSGFSVELRPEHPATIIETSHDPAAVRKWSLKDLPAPEGYRAAVVAQAVDFNLKLWSGNHFLESLD